MASFRTAKEAKDYIAERIAAEAARESVPLSEVERKMLYWSETDWTLPDMKQVGASCLRPLHCSPICAPTPLGEGSENHTTVVKGTVSEVDGASA